MARWKLMTSHYLNCVDPAEWEYSETDRTTGRQKRIRIPVPRYLDIRDPGDWTNKWNSGTNMAASKLTNEDGEIIVCVPGAGLPGDIEFLGDPTPDMMPVDDEAVAISKTFENHWRYKPEGTVNYSQSLVDEFQTELADVHSKPATVQVDGLSDLVAAMAAQTKALTEMLSARRV